MRRWINLLNEKWITSHDTSFGINEVFENPSKQQVSKLVANTEYGVIKGIIIPKSGDVFVWSNEEIEHREVEDHLQKEGIRLFFSKHGLEFENDDFDVYGIGGDRSDPVRIDWLNQQPNILRANGGPINNSIVEARSNPDKNPKIHPLDELKRLVKKHGPDLYVSFTMEFKFKKQRAPAGTKLGINPRSTFDTPMGIYCYPAEYIIDFTEEQNDFAKNFDIGNGGLDAPFTGYHVWGKAYVFKLAGARSLTSSLSMTEYDMSMDDLQQILKFNEEQMREFSYFSRARSKSDKPCFMLWSATRMAAVLLYEDKKDKLAEDKDIIAAWNAVMRKLGYQAAIDDQGEGFIHENEPTQGVIFDPSVIKVVSVIDRYDGDEKLYYSVKDRMPNDPRVIEKIRPEAFVRLTTNIALLAIQDYLDTGGNSERAIDLIISHPRYSEIIKRLANNTNRIFKEIAYRAYRRLPDRKEVKFGNDALADYVQHTDLFIDPEMGRSIALIPYLVKHLLRYPDRVEDWNSIARVMTGKNGDIEDVRKLLYPDSD